MPTVAKMSDVAIALAQVFEQLGVEFGIFGGYAVACLGGPRESKDIDCVVNCDKNWLVQQLSQVQNFRSMGNVREDVAIYVAQHDVTVELFPMNLQNLRSHTVAITGHEAGVGSTRILDPVSIFKGKLRAAATRSKHTDAADIVWLEGRFNEALKARNNEFNQVLVGMAAIRYPHLERPFIRLDCKIEDCKALAESRGFNPNAIQPAAVGDVQRGLGQGLS